MSPLSLASALAGRPLVRHLPPRSASDFHATLLDSSVHTLSLSLDALSAPADRAVAVRACGVPSALPPAPPRLLAVRHLAIRLFAVRAEPCKLALFSSSGSRRQSSHNSWRPQRVANRTRPRVSRRCVPARCPHSSTIATSPATAYNFVYGDCVCVLVRRKFIVRTLSIGSFSRAQFSDDNGLSTYWQTGDRLTAVKVHSTRGRSSPS